MVDALFIKLFHFVGNRIVIYTGFRLQVELKIKDKDYGYDSSHPSSSKSWLN
uniref:Uncharacterized protein n=1 Tax=Tetranychus urticae TaxID=32264 RepID=T1KI87_TETUR